MRWGRICAILMALVTGSAVVLPPHSAAAGTIPGGRVHPPTAPRCRWAPPPPGGVPRPHHPHHPAPQAAPWSWWPPAHWVDAHGPYDLNISSPTGARWVKFGFSAAPIANLAATPAQNAAAFFAYLRRNYRLGSVNGPGLYSRGLRSD